MRAKFFDCLSNMSNSSVAPVETLAMENEAEIVSTDCKLVFR